MPELPEIIIFARQMKRELVSKTISAIEVLQPKSLNVPEKKSVAGLTGAQITDVNPRGKGLFVEITQLRFTIVPQLSLSVSTTWPTGHQPQAKLLYESSASASPGAALAHSSHRQWKDWPRPLAA